MKRVEKGDFGQLMHKKKVNLLITIASFLVVISIFVGGLIVTGTRNNIATVAAIVLVLPAAKFAVGYFILLPHKGADKALADKIENTVSLPIFYDLIFSNKKSPIGTQAVVVSDSTICALTNEEKADTKLFETSLMEFMAVDNLKVTVTLYKDEKQFLSRIANIHKNFDYSNESALSRIERNSNSLKSMCL